MLTILDTDKIRHVMAALIPYGLVLTVCDVEIQQRHLGRMQEDEAPTCLACAAHTPPRRPGNV